MTTRLVIFDKDGTLVQGEVWDEITARMINEFVPEGRRVEAAASLGFDPIARTVLPNAPIMGESNGATIVRLFGFVDETVEHASDFGAYSDAIEDRCAAWIIDHVVEMEGATVLLETLASQGVTLALCTNDSESSARNQVDRLGWSSRLPVVFGYDSGHGEKPDPGMLLAAMAVHGVEQASNVVMVGDSFADLGAAEAAGVRSVYIGHREDHAARASHHITHLAQLPALLDG